MVNVNQPNELLQELSLIARELGFVGMGVSSIEPLTQGAEALDSWLTQEYHGEMTYMGNHPRRDDPTMMLDEAKTLLVVALPLRPRRPNRAHLRETPRRHRSLCPRPRLPRSPQRKAARTRRSTHSPPRTTRHIETVRRHCPTTRARIRCTSRHRLHRKEHHAHHAVSRQLCPARRTPPRYRAASIYSHFPEVWTMHTMPRSMSNSSLRWPSHSRCEKVHLLLHHRAQRSHS